MATLHRFVLSVRVDPEEERRVRELFKSISSVNLAEDMISYDQDKRFPNMKRLSLLMEETTLEGCNAMLSLYHQRILKGSAFSQIVHTGSTESPITDYKKLVRAQRLLRARKD